MAMDEPLSQSHTYAGIPDIGLKCAPANFIAMICNLFEDNFRQLDDEHTPQAGVPRHEGEYCYRVSTLLYVALCQWHVGMMFEFVVSCQM